MLLRRVPFSPPSWARHLQPPPSGRVLLGHLPTPLMPWSCPALKDLGVEWYIKRDDMSGAELSGNKVRKLEFLMAEALDQGADCVVTIGGLQSNHCRATAAAARLVGLEPHLVLLAGDVAKNADPGLEGNLLLDRMLGAKLHLCGASDYYRCGGDLAAMDRLNEAMADQLRAQGKRPYVVPVGGTCPMTAWAYVRAVQELCDQLCVQQPEEPPCDEVDAACSELPFDYIVFSAGSGGTATGLALGCRLARVSSELHAVNVQHTPESYYQGIIAEAKALGCRREREGDPKKWLQIHDGSKIPYGHAPHELLDFIQDVSCKSGVLLDHVYTGKALYYFCEHARANPEAYRGKRILFWHTGGLFGLYAKEKQLEGIMPAGQVQPMQPPPSL